MSFLSQLLPSFLLPSTDSLASVALKPNGLTRPFARLGLAHSQHRQSSSTSLPSRPTLRASRTPPSSPRKTIEKASALRLLAAEPSHYVVAFVLGKRYRLMQHDTLTVPHARDLRVGDVISLTRLTEAGSRSFTLRAPPAPLSHQPRRETAPPPARGRGRGRTRVGARPVGMLRPAVPGYLPEGLVSATALVVEHTRGKMLTVIKKKRRKGYRKTIKNKPYFTRLRISSIEVNPPTA